jgi:hypothetical protein
MTRHGRQRASPRPAGSGSRATSTAASCASREQIELLVREDHGHHEPGPLRQIHGEQHHVERHALAAGATELSDATVRWWVLDDDHRARRGEAALWASTGHAAAVFDRELYDVLPQTRGGYGYLQDFGIRLGYERVVLHLETHSQTGRLECNTARTLLLLDHQPLPWARWGEEFATAMPEEISRLQERAASADCLPRQDAIRSRVTALLPLYRLSRYRPTPPPSGPSVMPSTGSRAEKPRSTRIPRSAPPSSEPATHRAHASSNGELARGRAAGQPSARNGRHEALPPPTVNLPDVAWTSARDGTRAPGDLEDLAAGYHAGRHDLTINSDFRAISDLIANWCHRYRRVPGARTVIEGHVREWCEQILVEVVLAACNSAWSKEQLDALLSPTSFTAALVPRQLLHATLQKRLAQTWCTASPGRVTERGRGIDAARSHQVGESWPGRTARTAAKGRLVSRPIPARARQLAAELEQRFARDAELARKLNDAHRRLHAANDRLWSGPDPDGIAVLYDQHPAAVDVAFADNRSEVLGAPDPLQAIQQTHWQIHKAHCDYQRAADDRRQLAADIGEIMRTLVDELDAGRLV